MFQIDVLSRIPVCEQIIQQLERFILSGIIKAGEQIPSVRSIAIEHSINPRTILKAYSDLDAKGLIQSVPGKGYFVCENALSILNKDKMEELGTLSSSIYEMAMAGIPKEKVLECIENAYKLAKK